MHRRHAPRSLRQDAWHQAQAPKPRLLPLLLFALLAGAGALWVAAEPAAAQEGVATPGQTIPPAGTPMFLPLIAGNGEATPAPTATSTFTATPVLTATPTLTVTPVPTEMPNPFASVPVAGGSLGWPAQSSPDINLTWRSYTGTVAYLGLVNYNGDTDDGAPQMAGIFNPPRLPAFVAAYQVYDWDWNCNPPAGCRGGLLTWPYAVTLLEVGTTPGEALAIARRSAAIFNPGDYKALVLYAEENRLTLTYTRDDSPANGYLIHFEEVNVAPELVAHYRELDAAGRKRLPALRNGEIWGTAAGATMKVAIRDRGSFMDPRACKDWWVDYRSQCVVQLLRPVVTR